MPSRHKQQKKGKLEDRSKVHIKPRAYWKMRTHVLRYGNQALTRDDYKEVLGMLIGRNEKGADSSLNDVIIEDAVPVTHGGQIEVGFKPEDYVRFTTIDAQYAEQNLFTVGWYHSHPGLTTFFSGTDILNQLGFQAANPSAIGMVFDHERFSDIEDPGFDIFRLNNPGDGANADYHKVSWTLNPPKDPAFFGECIKNLFEQYQKKEPIIMELSEVPSIFGEWKLPKVDLFRENFSNASMEPVISTLEKSWPKNGPDPKIMIKKMLQLVGTKVSEIGDQYSENMTIIFKLLKQIDRNLSNELADLRENTLKHFGNEFSSLLNYQQDKKEITMDTVNFKLKILERIQENIFDDLSYMVSQHREGAE